MTNLHFHRWECTDHKCICHLPKSELLCPTISICPTADTGNDKKKYCPKCKNYFPQDDTRCFNCEILSYDEDNMKCPKCLTVYPKWEYSPCVRYEWRYAPKRGKRHQAPYYLPWWKKHVLHKCHECKFGKQFDSCPNRKKILRNDFTGHCSECPDNPLLRPVIRSSYKKLLFAEINSVKIGFFDRFCEIIFAKLF